MSGGDNIHTRVASASSDMIQLEMDEHRHGGHATLNGLVLRDDTQLLPHDTMSHDTTLVTRDMGNNNVHGHDAEVKIEDRKPSCFQMVEMRRQISSACFWRDVMAEFVATSALVSVQAALPLTWGKGHGGQLPVATGMGFVVTAMAWALGEFGGAHMNPAVTVGMAMCRKVTMLKAAVFILIQCAGGIAGAALIYVVTPEHRRDSLAATTLSSEIQVWQGVVIEAWLTFMLVITIHGSVNKRRKKDGLFMPTIPIGMAVTMGVICGYESTGASMNPARSLGPAIMMSIWDNHWVYWVGPIAGSMIATAIYAFLFDRVGRNKLD